MPATADGDAPATAMGGVPVPAAPPWARLGMAVAVSAVLHSAALYALSSPRAVAPARGFQAAITARLASATAAPGALPAEPAQRSARADQDASPGSGTSAPRGVVPPRYYPASQLDRPPVPLQAIAPEYPGEARIAKGLVALRVRINERGEVDDVTLLRAEPEGVFERSALAAFAAARFSPGVLNGAAVGSEIEVEVEYLPPKGTPFNPLGRSGGGY